MHKKAFQKAITTLALEAAEPKEKVKKLIIEANNALDELMIGVK